MSDERHMITIPVFPSTKGKGWPLSDDDKVGKLGACRYMALTDALTRKFTTDAHMQACSYPGKPHRLKKEAAPLLPGGVLMPVLVFDVDAPGKDANDTWWQAESEKVNRLFGIASGFCYRTRGGYRLTFTLPEPFVIDSEAAADKWQTLYQRRCLGLVRDYGIECDFACKDWTRYYRLPHVTRDGECKQYDSIGKPDDIGAWTLQLASEEVDLATAKRLHSLYVPKPGGQNPYSTILYELTPKLPVAPRSEYRREGGPSPMKRASAYLAAKDLSLQGAGGSGALWMAAVAMVRGFDLSDGDAMSLLWHEYNPRCVPPWNKGELEHKIKDARARSKKPFGYRLDATSPNYKRYEESEEEPPMREPGDGEGEDCHQAPKVSELDSLWTPVGVAIANEFKDRLGNRPKPRDWLLTDQEGEGVFPFGKCGILTAGGGTGKTAALCQLAVSVVLGVDWLGFKVPKPGKVVLALGEEDLEEVWRRLHKIINNLHRMRPLVGTDGEQKRGQLALDIKAIEENIIALPLAGCPVSFVATDNWEVKETGFLSKFREKLKGMKDAGDVVRLIVLDPLSRFAGAETEKDNAAATRFVQAVESLAKESEAAVLVASHSAKASLAKGETANVRGSSAIVDGFRWVSAMSYSGDYIRLENVKSNYSVRFEPFYLLMKDGVLESAGDTAEQEIENAEVETLRKAAEIKARANAEVKEKKDAEKAELERLQTAEKAAKKAAEKADKDKSAAEKAEAKRKAEEEARQPWPTWLAHMNKLRGINGKLYRSLVAAGRDSKAIAAVVQTIPKKPEREKWEGYASCLDKPAEEDDDQIC